MSAVLTCLPLPKLYYFDHNKNYYREDSQNNWIALNEKSAKNFILTQGYSEKRKDIGVCDADSCLLSIQSEQNVDYVGPLAGYKAGAYVMNRKLVLVSESPRLITPKEGEWPTIDKLLCGMFNDCIKDQRPYLYGWLKQSLEGLYKQQFAPGQVLAMAGDVNTGKSLFQRLFTEMMGGRAAKPYQFLTDKTTFNSDMFCAEHLMVEDEAESVDIRSRRHFAAGIKGIAVNRDHQCHGKYKDGLVLTPYWRMTISLNDDPERIQVLPPLDADIADKVMLLRVNRSEMPMPVNTIDERKRFENTLISELPHFIHFLLNWEIPTDLISSRFGIVHYHHPEILNSLYQTSPQYQLLTLIDLVLFPHASENVPYHNWEGKAVELEQLLCSDTNFGVLAKKLIPSISTCGRYLGRIEKQENSRVTSVIYNGDKIWTIRPPTNTPVIDFSN